MRNIHQFTGRGLIVAALTVIPAMTDATPGSTQTPPAGASSGQGTAGSTAQRERDSTQKRSSDGEPVGDDVPSQGTQTDQRGTTAAPNAPDAVGQLSAADRTFLLDALEGNKAEVELATMAMQKASSGNVKELARTIEQDHTEANTKLKSIAGKAGAADNEPALKPAHKQLQDRLAKLEGQAFDQAYAAEMVKEHEKDVAKYEKASKQLSHSGLKAYASETLPHLKQHLEKARQASTSRVTH
jgi:putative membrane protein